MIGKLLTGGLLAALSLGSAQAASDYPSGYTKCAKVGASCSMSGTRSVALGKSGSFVYATLSGNFTCSKGLFSGGSAFADSAWCSYAKTTTSSSASSSVASSAASSSAVSSASSSVASSSSSAASSSSVSSSSASSASVALNAVASGGKIQLNWAFNGVSVSKQEIYRDTDSNPSGRTRLATLSTSATSYVDASAAAGQTYFYWVKYVAGGVTSNSNAASATLSVTSSSASSASSSSSINSSSASSSVSSSAASNPYVTGCGTETSNLTASKVYYVTPSGSASGAGSSFAAPMSLSAALSQVGAGQMVLLQPGTYKVAYTAGAKNTITLSKSGTSSAKIYLVAANCGKAIVDFQFPEKTWVQDSYGFYVTGSYWYFKGIEITRAGYQGAYVTGGYNTFENVAFHNNRNSGLEINKGGHHTMVINSDAYRNYDPKKNGSMADGFASKQTQGAGNFFYGCRAWENSDDGWDTFDSAETVVIENSWTFRNGVDVWGYGSFAGNGNGFKLGGNYKLQRNRIINSVSFGHPNKGFDQNNNTGGVTLINNTSYKNGINYGFGGSLASGEKNVFTNNVSLSGSKADSIANATVKNNSWNGIGVGSADFVSLDTNLATQARAADGSLPTNNLFRLSANSKLINAGVNAGLPYKGSAPDLGAFERE